MVQFLLDNTLGAWWTARHPEADLDFDFEYLRFVEDEETGEEVPAAGTYDGWPDTAAELTVMDPCMGSGHFLVAALPMLARMRMHEEGLSAEEAVDRVIAENLHGLEIDERCTQLAAFALAMAAWTFNGASGYRELPEMNLACSGLAPEGDLEDWETLAGDDERLQNGMRRLYSIFQDAPTLGSLINPSAPENRLDTATFDELEPLLDKALSNGKGVEMMERGVLAYGIARAADMLSSEYHLVNTNVPYLKRGNQSQKIKEYISNNYPKSKRDLATAFAERGFSFSAEGGIFATVLPQSGLFLQSYEKWRKMMLRRRNWKLLARLGKGAFETISGEVVNVILAVFNNQRPTDDQDRITGIDVSESDSPKRKSQHLVDRHVSILRQSSQLQNPDSRVLFVELEDKDLLRDYSTAYEGLTVGDLDRFTRYFWELSKMKSEWNRFIGNVVEPNLYGGRSQIIKWEGGVVKFTSTRSLLFGVIMHGVRRVLEYIR